MRLKILGENLNCMFGSLLVNFCMLWLFVRISFFSFFWLCLSMMLCYVGVVVVYMWMIMGLCMLWMDFIVCWISFCCVGVKIMIVMFLGVMLDLVIR